MESHFMYSVKYQPCHKVILRQTLLIHMNIVTILEAIFQAKQVLPSPRVDDRDKVYNVIEHLYPMVHTHNLEWQGPPHQRKWFKATSKLVISPLSDVKITGRENFPLHKCHQFVLYIYKKACVCIHFNKITSKHMAWC